MMLLIFRQELTISADGFVVYLLLIMESIEIRQPIVCRSYLLASQDFFIIRREERLGSG